MSGDIILIQDRIPHIRKNIFHLVDYCTPPPTSNKYTLCDMIFQKSQIVNTFSIDNVIDNICVACRLMYNSMYADEFSLNNVRISRGGTLEALKRKIHMRSGLIKAGRFDNNFSNYVNRDFGKMKKYKKKLNGNLRK